MEGRLHDFMRVGIVQFMMYPACLGGRGPQVETATRLAENPFFDVIEIGPIVDPAARAEVVSRLRQARVEIAYDGQPLTLLPGLDLEAEDPDDRRIAIEAMMRGIDEAVAVGSETCGVMSGKVWPPELDRARATERLVASLGELCTYARPLGITLCLENFDSVPYSKNCLIGATAEAAELAKAVRREHENFGLLLDLSHIPILGETARGMVDAGGEFVVRTQIGNASTDPYSAHYGDDHPYFGAPRTDVGIDDLAEFLRALCEIGFLSRERRGIVSFEIKPLPSEDPEACTAGCVRALREAWSRV